MRTLFFCLFFLASITLFAQEENFEKGYTKEIELTSSVEDAWRLLSDVSMWKEWDSHIVDARLNEDFADNSRGSLVTANSKVVDFQIMDFIEGESYTIRHKLSSGVLYLRRSVTSNTTGSRVLVNVWYKGLSFRNFKKYMGNDYASVLEKELQNFHGLLEN